MSVFFGGGPMSVIYLDIMLPLYSSVLPCSSDEQSSNATIHELAAPKMHSQKCHHSAGRLLPYLLTLTADFDSLNHVFGSDVVSGCFLLHYSTLANCFYIRKWSALCCPDFPLTHGNVVCQRQTALLLYVGCKGTDFILCGQGKGCENVIVQRK